MQERSNHRLIVVLLIVATASLSSLVTLVLAPDSGARAQSLRTTRAPGDAEDEAGTGAYHISAYGWSDPPASRRDEPKGTLGFYVLNQRTGQVANCIYMWAGEPMNRCTSYAWVTLP